MNFDTINLNVRGMGESATLAINARSADLKRQGKAVFRLGLGQSPFPVPPPVVEALRANAHQKDYLPVKGLPELQRAIAASLKQTQGLEFRDDHILVGPGSKELMFIVQLTYYGDLVIPSPSWVSYAPQARIIGRQLHWLPTDPKTGLGVTPKALDGICRDDPDRPRLLILNYPGNPTGTSYDEAQLRAIADVARKYGVLVLSDEIYGGLHFAGEHVSIARFYQEGTIVSNGLSKWCGAGGWRLGAFAFPETMDKLLRCMAVVASETFTSTSAPIQWAAVRAFEGGAEIDTYVVKSRRILAGLAACAYRRLIAAGAKVCEPKGGFYLFPNFEAARDRLAARGIETGAALCVHLLDETGVATLPGSDFGRPDAELSMRLALVDFDGGAALAALDSDEEVGEAFLASACPRVVEALGRVVDFVA